MSRLFLFFSAVFLFYCGSDFVAYADAQAGVSVAGESVMDLSNPAMEKEFEAEENVLRKVKIEHLRQERKIRLKEAQQAYNQALNLYRQRRLSLARDELKNVQDIMTSYKSTDAVLSKINKKAIEKLKRRANEIMMLQDPHFVDTLVQKAADLEAQAEDLGDDKTTWVVRKKLIKVKRAMEKLKRQRMAVSQQEARQLFMQEELDRIDEKAEEFDKEIYRLTQAKEFTAAERKYYEFQQVMIDDLEKLKKTMGQDDAADSSG